MVWLLLDTSPAAKDLSKVIQDSTIAGGSTMAKIKENAGFTLLEIMLVVIIISIGASVAYFSIRGSMPDKRLSTAARDLKSDLNLARLRAVKDHRNVLIAFNDAGGSYSIFVDDDGDFVADAAEAVKTVNMPVGITMSTTLPGVTAMAAFNSRGLLQAVPPFTTPPTSPDNCISFSNSNNNWRRVDLALTGKSTILAKNNGASDFAELH